MSPEPSAEQPVWAELSTGQRIRSLEVEGYVVLPGTLDDETIARLKAQASSWDPTPVHYSQHQRTQSDVQFAGGAVTELIAHPPVIEFLRAALGPDLVFMHAHYAISAPGHPGMNLHTDSPPVRDQRLGPCLQRAAPGSGFVLPGRPDAGRCAAASGATLAAVHAPPTPTHTSAIRRIPTSA